MGPKSKNQVANSRVFFWSKECKYSVITDHVKELGWKAVKDEKSEDKTNLFWIDSEQRGAEWSRMEQSGVEWSSRMQNGVE
jgi:hypothetical protein